MTNRPDWLPEETHDWGDAKIVGHYPQSEPAWVGRGHMPPIYEYTCKACGEVRRGDGHTILLRAFLGPPCPKAKQITDQKADP